MLASTDNILSKITPRLRTEAYYTNTIVLSRIEYCESLISDVKNIEVKKIDRIIRASIRLIYNINRIEHMKTYEHQHNLKWLLFRKRCKHRLLCLAHKSIFLGKPDYLHNQLKRR